jgi:hypothetical protein
VGRIEGTQELQDRVVSAVEMGSAEELLRVRKEIVDFHGEMVLLENYSALNYTGEHALPCRALFLVTGCRVRLE